MYNLLTNSTPILFDKVYFQGYVWQYHRAMFFWGIPKEHKSYKSWSTSGLRRVPPQLRTSKRTLEICQMVMNYFLALLQSLELHRKFAHLIEGKLSQ